MEKGRLLSFSDGVLAIIITIMVLELRVPLGDDISVLKPLLPVFVSYILSFINIGIYWNNHHHMLYTIQKVNGATLWANLHLLFWLSLMPFATGWMGENHFTSLPVAVYGVVLLMSAIAYFILARILISSHGKDSTLATAFGKDVKGKISPIMYIIAIPLSFVNAWIGLGIYIFVALIWLIPDRRIEKVVLK
jgi:TMEM175 potassium channel family protein